MAPPLKLLIYPPVDPQRLDKIRNAAGEMQVVNAETPEQALAQAPGCDGFYGKLTAELLAAARQIRWVQSPTASLEHYVFPELAAHSLTLTNMRGLFSDVIADHVFAYILCFARNLHRYLRQQQQRQWSPCGGETSRSSFAAGPGQVTEMDRAHRHLGDDTLGVFGMGHIGREVARRGQAFGMRILALDPYVTPAQREQTPGVQWLEGDQLQLLLGESDFVVIAAPHTPETAGLFGPTQIGWMKSNGVLINIGRGVIVQLDALAAALREGQLGGAALDVFEQEPLPPEHPLWEMENVIITPHVAACSTRVPQRHLQTLLENVRRFATGAPLLNVVRKDLWF